METYFRSGTVGRYRIYDEYFYYDACLQSVRTNRNWENGDIDCFYDCSDFGVGGFEDGVEEELNIVHLGCPETLKEQKTNLILFLMQYLQIAFLNKLSIILFNNIKIQAL